MKAIQLALSGLTALALISCENPADQSTAAKTTDAKSVPASNTSGSKWVFTPSSTIQFVGSKVTGSHDGGFKEFTGHFHFDDGKLAKSGHLITIDMNSTWSDDEMLTGHLKSADFFDVDTYPQSTFVATDLRESTSTEEGTHQLTGNFKLHGIEKSIEFPVTVKMSEEQANITADFFINRFDYDIKYPGKSDDLIRKEVVIKLDLIAIPAES